jgi:hypothetical protein
MLLTSFLHELLTTGAITLAGRPAPFEAADVAAAETLLRTYYAADALELPHAPPDFDAAAAGWAAGYLYYTALLALVRELDEAVIAAYLPAWAREATPAVIYSVDLLFRYLPALLGLAKGLAPGDALVTRLEATARQWPFSFVGHGIADPDAEAAVLAHPALRAAYLDRIIDAQDRERASQPHLMPGIQAALGGHAASLWPDFHAFSFPA